ncbi:MAG: hypothetical protein EXS05_00015 [Planctomycetaceae bacterium]|nr:hypothetical protein [Planctomycetaceae bacterium]
MGGGGYDPALYDAIASQCDAGVLFVAAAGNSHSNNNATPFYPASYDLDNIIAVAATTNTDALASFSSYGLTTVDLAAPGTSILSTTPGNTYGSLSGTSMATPHVVGVAALAMSLAPDANYQQIRAAVLGGVDPRASLSGIVASGGRLNAAGTLNYLLSHAAATPSNYLAAATTYEPIDLNPADSGVVTVLDGVDDGAAAIDLGVNTFTFYGTTYTGASSLFVSSNGLITFGSANPTAANTNLSASPSQAAIAPFWDDLRTDLDGAADLVLSRFEDTTGDSVRDRLVIEWSSVRHAPGSPSPATFQAVLQLDTGSSDGNIVFNYGDLDFGDATVDNGAGATVGLKAAGAQGLDRLLVAKNNGVHPLIGSGRAILFERTRPVGDIVDVAPDPHLSSVPSVDVTFTRPIDLASFDFHDVTLTRNGGANLITSAVTVSFVSGSTYRINGLTNITGYDGTYAATVNMGGIADLVGQHGTGSISDTWTADNPPPDIQMLSATANGSTTLTVTYEVLTSPVDPFNLGVYRSSDATVGGDVLLATVSLSATADTTVGTHVKTFTIGSGAGQIALPAAGAAEVDADYFLLFVADPTDAIPETDASSPGDNNVVAFAGVYHAAKNLVQVHGSGAADTVTVSATPGVTYNGTTSTYSTGDVTGLRIRAHGGNDVVNAAAYTKPLLAFGGDGNDTLTGGTGADVLDGGAGDDTLAGNAGNDSYIFDADTPLGSDTLADSAGIDTLDFSATTTHAITVNLSLTTVQTVNANLGLTLGSNAAFENVIGGALGDSMTGNTLANLITGGPGDDTLAGASGNDTYVFDADAALGSDTLVEATGGGTETLDFSSTTTQAIAVNLSTTTTQVVNGNVSLTLSAADTFESVTGGALGDTLTGNALANTLTGGAGNDELAGGAGNDNLVGGAGDDTLAGGDDKDTYIFDADSALGSDTIAETAGADTLDFSPTSTKTIAFNLSVTTPQVVAAGNLTLTLGAGDAIENLTGGSLDDVLIGNALANTLTGNAGNDMLTGNDGNDVLVGGAGADLLKGGNGDDKYSFDADSALGSDTIDELVGAGVDTLDFSATTTQGLTVNLSLGSTQVVNGNLTLTLGAGDVIDRVIGGSLDDVLIGNALANTLTGGAGNDTLTGNDGNDVLVGGVGNDLLTGGNGDDVYAFDADAALGSDTLAESAGVDLLDFSQTTTVAIAINLASTSAQPVNGNLNLTLLSGGDLEMVVGSSKNDTILGNSLNNVLIGGAGNDTIGGLGGLDLVVGGTGVDNLNGGDDDDLLIAGKLSYYDESTLILNRPAIDAVMAEWTRIDLAYDLRIDHLKNGTGLNGTFKLDSTTVLADGSSIDTMIGEAGLDWFWKFGSDAIADLGNGGIEAFN